MITPSPLKITLDTNCVINLFDRNSRTATSVEELNEIFRRALSHTIDLAITTRVEVDLSADKDEGRRQGMLKVLELLPVVGTVGRWGTSRWNSGDRYVSDDQAKLWSELCAVLFPGLSQSDKRFRNKQMDIDHLVGHRINDRNIFLTDDTEILKKLEPLWSQFNIQVMTPKSCIAYVRELEEKANKPLGTPPFNQDYVSATASGHVIFDYSNNNGRFIIGNGAWLFETAWSKASDVLIHAYHDAESIDAIALEKTATRIEELGDVAQLDYSSRIRTARTSQIVVWRNTKGFYAATVIRNIKDDRRGDPNDELDFEYKILVDGSSKF